MRPRVALLQPYWSFWEASVPFDLQIDRLQFEARVKESLDVEWVDQEHAETLLVLQTMATPPASTIDQLGDLPLVVWAAHRQTRIPRSFDHGGITSEGATVGAPMLTSVLVREGRPFEFIVGRIGDPSVTTEVASVLRGAAAARRLRGARVARIGVPQPGYACVDSPSAKLENLLGIEIVPLEPSVVKIAYDHVSFGQVEELLAEVRELYDFHFVDEGFSRSLRAACAIEALVEEYRLDAGALNCHVPEIRFEGLGITPCFALGRSTTRGVPWTCTGDVLTAVAMLIAKTLGAAAQYHELEAYDYETDEFVIASSGEHDLDFTPEARPSLIKNSWFASDRHTGVCACYTACSGPASLLALADIGDDYRLIVAEGEITGRAFPDTGTANAAFRFTRGLSGWANWCRFGANHHSSATHGTLASETRTCARFLGIEHAIA